MTMHYENEDLKGSLMSHLASVCTFETRIEIRVGMQQWLSEKKALQVVALLDPLLQSHSCRIGKYVKEYLLLIDMSERHSAGSIWLAEQSSIVTTCHSLFPLQQGINLLYLCFSFTIVHS